MNNSLSELERILRHHARKYPLMMPTDAVKLIYQNEFGGGHLIRDERTCLEYLEKEYRSTPQTDSPLTEDIGGGTVRVSLAALDAHRLTPSALGEVFIRSALLINGSVESLKAKLALLRRLTEEDALGFSTEALDEYILSYEKAGFPAVSHSPEYRAAYSPAYRIVLSELLRPYVIGLPQAEAATPTLKTTP